VSVRNISILEANDLGIVLACVDPESKDIAYALALETIANVESTQPVIRYDIAELDTGGEQGLHASAETLEGFLPLLREFVSLRYRYSTFLVWLNGTGRKFVFANLAEDADGFSFGPSWSAPEGYGESFLASFQSVAGTETSLPPSIGT
jgi:hypothetical protein